MTNAERASELRRLRGHLGGKQFRMDLRIRPEILGRIVPLLNFSQVYHTNPLQFADMMSQEGFSSRMYESCEGRLDVLVGQAINELEHDLTPPGSAATRPRSNSSPYERAGTLVVFSALHDQDQVVDDCFRGNRSRSGDNSRVPCRPKPFQ